MIASTFALSFGAYCASRSGNEIQPINELLKDLTAAPDMRGWTSPKLNLRELCRSKDTVKIVALGDNVTLGLQNNWEIKFQETYHYQWLHDLKLNTSLANNAISGAGVLDLALYLGRDAIYYKPDVVLINYGLNDAWLGKQILLAYENLLEVCIRILQGNKIQVVLISPSPQIPSACPMDQRPTDIQLDEAEVSTYAQACKRIAVRTGCVFADAYSKFPSSEHERKQYLANGFNMPNLAGQKLIKSALDDITN
jgi:lysophospholipase L1-like esterase